MAVIKYKKSNEPAVNKKSNTVVEKKKTHIKKHNNPSVLYEDETKRTKHSNYYVLNDKTAEIIVSSSEINYFDEEESSWKKIDNELVETADSYVNKNGKHHFEVKKPNKGRIVKIGDNNKFISWEYLGSKDIKEELIIPKQEKGQSNISSAIYRFGESMDLEYIFHSKGVKENIIVKEKRDNYKYDFILNIKGLKLRLSEAGNRVELYEEINNKDVVKFIIPAPYMYDFKGNKSYEVYYEIEKLEEGKYSFSVIADEVWINSEDTTFPVTIDPQIVGPGIMPPPEGDGGGTTTTPEEPEEETAETQITNYITTEVYSCSTDDNDWELRNSDGLTAGVVNSLQYKAVITINKSLFEEYGSDFSELYLYLKIESATFLNKNYCTIYYNNKIETITINDEYLKINLMDYIESYSKNIVIEITCNDNPGVIFNKTGCPPYILLKKDLNENYISTTKDYTLSNVVKGKFFVDNCTLLLSIPAILNSNNVFGMSENHTYVQSVDSFNCGKNFRLNLQESFIRIDDESFKHISSNGLVHYYRAKFYYLDSTGNKIYLDDSKKDEIVVDAMGNLTCKDINNKIRSVSIDYISIEGLKVYTQKTGIKNINFIEQRNDETKSLEEEVKSFENHFNKLVCFDIEKLEIDIYLKNRINNISSFSEFISYVDSKENLYLLSKESCQLYKEVITELNNTNDTIDELTEVIGELEQEFVTTNSSELEEEKAKAEKQLETLQNNLEILEGKISLMKENSLEELNGLEDIYKQYLEIKKSLFEAKTNTPINFLSNGSIIKGFNEYGNLVVIYDMYENYTNIEYETYYDLKGVEKTRIARLCDSFGKVVTLSYDNDFNLETITDTLGYKTTYKYDNGYLKEVSYSSGEVIVLEYDDEDNITEINENKNKIKTSISYTEGKVNTISYYPLTSNSLIDEVTFVNSNAITTITNGATVEKYQFDSRYNKIAYVLVEDGVVTKAEKYTYNPYWVSGEAQDEPRYVVSSVNKVYLGTSGLSDLSFDTLDNNTSLKNGIQKYGTTTTVINQFNQPVSKSTSSIKITDNTTKTTLIKYTYDNEQKLIEEEVVVNYYDGDDTSSLAIKTVTKHKKYIYNSYGNVIKTETYVEGEEYTNGKTIEETIYDNKGNVIKSFTYNSLDPSSKFYSETEYNEEGQAIVSYDSTGEHKTISKYINNELLESILPNGSRIGYGYLDRENVSITHSTIEGEENSNQKIIKDGQVVEVNSGNNHIKYTYDYKGRITNINLDGIDNYVTFAYIDDFITGVLKEETITYKNGAVVTKTYDSRGNLTNKSVDNINLVTRTYDDYNLLDTIEVKNGSCLQYIRDSFDRVNEVLLCGYDSTIEEFFYDSFGNLSFYIHEDHLLYEEYSYEYSNDSLNRLTKTIVDGNITFNYNYDKNNRYIGKRTNDILNEKITYYKVGDHATNLPSVIRFDRLVENKIVDSESIRYTYDCMGNIHKVYQDGELAIRYTYDSLNRLVREDNKPLGETKIFVYDNNGNILKQRMFDFTLKDILSLEEMDSTDKEYLYEGDRLLSFDGNLLTYNENGLLSNYQGNQISWTSLKQLAGYGSNTFTYDGLGRRTRKNNIHYYYDSSSKLVSEGNGQEIIIRYFYDKNGVSGFIYNDETYFYRKNTQGDVIAILDLNGNIVVRYLYDGWGNHKVCNPNGIENTTSDFIGNINPIRYRGYYYDVETGLFMVGHRYYNPEWGRWLSPDDIEYLDPQSINGLNLYAYCNNDPVMNYDPSGHEPLTILMIVLLSSLISVTILAVDSPNAEITGPSFDEPTFFSATEKGFNIISGGGNLGKKTWYLDDNKNSSFYFQGFSGELSLGIPYDVDSINDLFSANLYLFKFGYDGKYLDIGIPLGFDPEFISFDFSQIYKDIKSLFN